MLESSLGPQVWAAGRTGTALRAVGRGPCLPRPPWWLQGPQVACLGLCSWLDQASLDTLSPGSPGESTSGKMAEAWPPLHSAAASPGLLAFTMEPTPILLGIPGDLWPLLTSRLRPQHPRGAHAASLLLRWPGSPSQDTSRLPFKACPGFLSLWGQPLGPQLMPHSDEWALACAAHTALLWL